MKAIASLRPTVLRNALLVILVGAVLLGVTELVSPYRNAQIASAGLSFCAIAGLTVLTGLSGQVSLGNGAFMFVGAYTVALLIHHHPLANGSYGYSSNWWLVPILLAAAVAAAIVGGLVGIAAARLRGPYLAGITLALALGLPVLPKYQHLQGPLGGHAGIPATPPDSPGGIDLERWQAWVCLLAALLVLLLLANLVSSRVGRSFTAVRDDEVAASLAGMSVARIQILAFVVSAATAGLAGGLFAYVNDGTGPDFFPLQLSLSLLAAAVFGGLGSLTGAAYGAVLITFLQGWSNDIANHLSLPDKVGNNLPLALYGVTLIVAMLVFPFGLQGLIRRLIGRVRPKRPAPPAVAR
jgi:branched-chain amino acid transport system permease protein